MKREAYGHRHATHIHRRFGQLESPARTAANRAARSSEPSSHCEDCYLDSDHWRCMNSDRPGRRPAEDSRSGRVWVFENDGGSWMEFPVFGQTQEGFTSAKERSASGPTADSSTKVNLNDCRHTMLTSNRPATSSMHVGPKGYKDPKMRLAACPSMQMPQRNSSSQQMRSAPDPDETNLFPGMLHYRSFTSAPYSRGDEYMAPVEFDEDPEAWATDQLMALDIQTLHIGVEILRERLWHWKETALCMVDYGLIEEQLDDQRDHRYQVLCAKNSQLSAEIAALRLQLLDKQVEDEEAQLGPNERHVVVDGDQIDVETGSESENDSPQWAQSTSYGRRVQFHQQPSSRYGQSGVRLYQHFDEIVAQNIRNTIGEAVSLMGYVMRWKSSARYNEWLPGWCSESSSMLEVMRRSFSNVQRLLEHFPCRRCSAATSPLWYENNKSIWQLPSMLSEFYTACMADRRLCHQSRGITGLVTTLIPRLNWALQQLGHILTSQPTTSHKPGPPWFVPILKQPLRKSHPSQDHQKHAEKSSPDTAFPHSSDLDIDTAYFYTIPERRDSKSRRIRSKSADSPATELTPDSEDNHEKETARPRSPLATGLEDTPNKPLTPATSSKVSNESVRGSPTPLPESAGERGTNEKHTKSLVETKDSELNGEDTSMRGVSAIGACGALGAR